MRSEQTHARSSQLISSPLVGEDRGGGASSLFDTFQYRLRNRLGMSQDLVVPEPQHAIALSLQPASAIHVVARVLRMLATIHFDDHPAFETHEVHDERADGLLAAKLHAGELTALELLPQTLFRPRQVFAQFSRAFSIHPPIPTFPHEGGRCALHCISCAHRHPRKSWKVLHLNLIVAAH